MLPFLSSLSASSIPKKYQSLAQKAIDNSKLKKAHSYDEIMYPGDYEFGGISFHLTRKLANPYVPQIDGYAKEDNVIALVQSRKALDDGFDPKDTYLADPATQKIYQLSQFAGDSQVTLFNADETNPLNVFANLLMKTKPAYGYNCTINETTYMGARCKAWFSYNWPTPQEGEDPLSLRPLYHNITKDGQIMYNAGAYGQATGQVAVQFSGLFEVTADFDVDVNAVGGIGLSFKEKVFDFSYKIHEFTFPIYGTSISVLGVKLAFGVEAFVGLELNHISVDLPDFDYYRDFVFNFHKSGKLSSKSGYHGDPFSYDIHSDTSSNLDNLSVMSYIERTKFGIEPTIDLGIRAVAEVGDLLKTSLDIGSHFKLNLEFAVNRTMCTAPYIHGSTQFGLDFYIRSPGIKILNLNVVKGFELKWDAYKSRRSPDVCLFSPYNSREGIISLTSETRIPSVVIKPTGAYPPADHPADKSSKYSPRLEAYSGSDASSPYRTLELQTLHFGKHVGGQEYTLPLSRMLVLTDPRESTVMKYSVINKGLLFADKYHLQDEFTINEDLNKSICGFHQAKTVFGEQDGLCLNTEVFRSENVEEFKEFDANRSYIAVKPSRAVNGDIFALITHGENETYKAPLSKFDALDDAALVASDVKKGEYHFKRFLNITLDKFFFNDGNDKTKKASITFQRCVGKKMNECEEIGHLFLPEVKKNIDYTSQSLKVQEFAVPFDLSGDNFNLKVIVDINDNDKALKTFTFTREEIDFDGKFTRPKSINSDKYKITLRFTNVAPTMLFQVDNALSEKRGYKGIVSRVFQPSKVFANEPLDVSFTMLENETYGILRFFIPYDNDELAKNGKFSCIINSKNIVPLCQYDALDSEHILINLEYGETLFSTAEQTHYFNGVVSINIPFRRQELIEKSYTVSLVSAFMSDGNGICSLTSVIQGYIKKGVHAGCVDKIDDESSKSFTILFSGLSSAHFDMDKQYEKPEWALLSYKAKNEEYAFFEMRTRYDDFVINENTSSLFIDGARAMEFKNSNRSIEITCDRCSSLRVEPEKYQSLIEKRENKFIFNPTTKDDLIFVAQCLDSENKYCEFQEDFSNDGLCLIEYQSPDGVREVNFTADDGLIMLLDGVTRQIVHGRKVSNIIKTWAGKIIKIATNILADNLIITIEPHTDGRFEIIANFAGLQVPFSVRLFRKDPTKFLELISIIQPAGGFVDGDIEFTAKGTIIIRGALLGDLIDKFNKKTASADDNIDLLQIVDIPASYIKSATVQCSSNSKLIDGKCVANNNNVIFGFITKENVAILAPALVAAVVVVVGIVIFLAKRNRNDREDQTTLTSELTIALRDAEEA
jgi:hypothetical protein